jgi:hypothetical protein
MYTVDKLDFQTRPATLGEANKIPIQAVAALLRLEPSLRVEFLGIGKYRRVHVHEEVGFSSGSMRDQHPSP